MVRQGAAWSGQAIVLAIANTSRCLPTVTDALTAF
jgi:hypothetical protein